MSMPSSRLLVATTAGSRPRLRSSSIRARCSLETEPWWALAITGALPSVAPDWPIAWAGTLSPGAGSTPARSAAISLRRAVSRSESRRELAKTMVELCCSIRSTTRSSTCGQMLETRSAPPPGSSSAPGSSSKAPPGLVMSSTGTTTERSHCFSLGGATTSTGAVPPR